MNEDEINEAMALAEEFKQSDRLKLQFGTPEEKAKVTKMIELDQAWDKWAHHTFGSTRTAMHKIGQMGDRLYRPNIQNLDTFKEMYGMK